MCVENRPLLRVGPFIIVRRYSYGRSLSKINGLLVG
jgi:hypothetical protein